MPVAKSKILLTGASGQVGGDLLPLLTSFGEVIAPTRGELDLGDGRSIRAMVREVAPRWIVNAGAYTAVDKAESEPDAALAINGDAPRILGEEAAAIGAAVIHFSTDYVFNGQGNKPWTEEDAPSPLNIYGATKLIGEEGLAQSGAAHVVFRTSWVYGARGRNFLRSILKMALDCPTLRIVADQYGAPTWSHDLARLAIHTMRRAEQLSETAGHVTDALRQFQGVYHAAGAGETSWFGFAQEFVRLAKEADPSAQLANLLPITTFEYPTPAQRPRNSRLNCEKLVNTLGFKFREWPASVAEVMREIDRT